MTFMMLVFFGIAAGGAGSSHGNRVDITDDCNATFNAAPPVGPGLGPGTCVRNGDTSFQNFIGQLVANGVQANRSAKGWAFEPGQLKIDAGQGFEARNEGGEFHTFSEVQNFGGGCVPPLNAALGGLTPVPECQPRAPNGQPAIFATTGVPSGRTLNIPGLAPGVHHFECLIHPWMRTDVVVAPAENDDD
jgi:plastocyanin